MVAWGNAVAGLSNLEGFIGSTNPPGTVVASDTSNNSDRKSVTFVVPVGWYYKVSLSSGQLTANAWEM